MIWTPPNKGFKKGDVVWICGVCEPRVNLYVRGIVHHSFIGHGYNHYVIAVDILDGDFEVRCDSTTFATEKGHREPNQKETT